MSFEKLGPRLRKEARTYRVPGGFEQSAIKKFLFALDCPRSLAVWIMFRENEHDQLAALECNPDDYSDEQSARAAYLSTLYLSKYKGLRLSTNKDEVAKKKFLEFEDLCANTNSRFRSLSSDPKYTGQNVWLHNAVIREIDRVLGDFSFEEFISLGNWGPGASTLIKRREASSQEKFQCETGITRDLHALLPVELLFEVFPHWAVQLLEAGYPTYQIGNKVTTVPKNAKTNRVIAIEPGINLWFQKAIGSMIRSRLLRVGIDLNDQSRNQALARVGSIKNSLASVDFSSASDSIASSVVEALLPPRWFSVMDSCRSHYGIIDDSQFRWNKFSSMGNGFTFELETLIFYACGKACMEYASVHDSLSVYGDDVILPSSVFDTFSVLVDFYGFRINKSKSFVNSCFRESCGAHYYLGRDFKPLYLKEEFTSVLHLYRYANAIRRLSRREYLTHCDKRFRNCFVHCIQQVPHLLRLRIPEGFGDTGFISNFDEACPSRCRHWIEGFRFYHVVEVASSNYDDRIGYLLAEYWRLSRRQGRDNYGPGTLPAKPKTISELTEHDVGGSRYNRVLSHHTRMKVAKGFVNQWCDLGPWL